jgi:hypothetical protein
MNRATLRPELLLKFNPDENRDVKELKCRIFLKKSLKYILYLLKKQSNWATIFTGYIDTGQISDIFNCSQS